MKIKIRLTEPIWRTVESREVTLELANETATVGAVLSELARLHPKFGEEIYGGPGEGDYHYGLFLNDQIVGLAQREEFVAKDGDEIFILLPVAGGDGS
ncbi:MAG: MoaD/ThiS family protein [Chloroflexi bacterium]|nr:MoaD/ThiS family protein [Chloroflexota bacterium]MDA8186989.1 MoaD/ThiS family protein [Dehalococcoidales bacterium]